MKVSGFSFEPVGRFGTEISKVISSVESDAEDLQKLLGSTKIPELDTLSAVISDWRFSLAAVGQMKAGKSSYLNAIMDTPDLLPSDVNPWTTVVTKLRFGHPDEPTSGGRFHFFSENDWNQIIERSKDATEHLDDLIVGFDQSVLTKQFEDMRARAKLKLGNLYPLLLGNSHGYDTITKNILERYVAAGVDADGEKTGHNTRAGYYADITKYAEIYFPKSRYDVPSVVIDTPGVNDPYLVRDEFTCQVLGDADVYLMFMSVHQALTPFDQSFIEILARQQGKKIIVVINRVDELDNFGLNAKRVVADVEKRLAQAGFQDSIQAVIAGSATWAQAARNEQEADVALPLKEMKAMIKSLYGIDVKNKQQCLEMASGLYAVERSLENALNTTTGLAHIHRIQDVLLASLTAAKRLISTELRDNKLLTDETDSGVVHSRYVQILEDKFKDAKALEKKYVQESQKLEQQNSDIFSNVIAASKRELAMSLRDIINCEAYGLADKVEGDSDKKEIAIDLTGLRDEIFEFAKTFFVSKQARLHSEHTKFHVSIDKLVTHFWTDTESFDFEGTEFDADFAPILPNYNENLKIALTSKNRLMFWKKSKFSHDEFSTRSQQVLSHEMAGTIAVIQKYITNTLVSQHEEYQKAYAGAFSATEQVLRKSTSTLATALEKATETDVVDTAFATAAKQHVAALEADIKAIDKIAAQYT